MGIQKTTTPVSGAPSFQSLIHTDAAGKPEERLVVQLAEAAATPVRISSQLDSLNLAKLQNGTSANSSDKRPEFGWNLKKFLGTV